MQAGTRLVRMWQWPGQPKAARTPDRRRAAVGAIVALAVVVNVALGAGVSRNAQLTIVAIVAIALAAAVPAVFVSAGWFLAVAALSIPLLLPVGFEGRPLPLGGSNIYLPDIVVTLAVASAFAAAITGVRSGRFALPHALLWPFLLLTAGLLIGVLRGHERYGSHLVGQPFRTVLYAAIGLALFQAPVRTLYRGIVVAFYAGAVLEALLGLFYLATGRSQTDQIDLSTGGSRALALGTAMYLCGALLIALLNFERADRVSRQMLHLGIAALAAFGIAVAYGRTNFAALALVLPVLLVGRKYLRRSVLRILPLLVPFAALGALVVPPRFLVTIVERISGTSTGDVNVLFRLHAAAATLAGISHHLVLGFGFDRPVTMSFTYMPSNLPYLLPRTYTATLVGDPHDSYVWLLAGGGLLTLAPFLALLAAYAVDAIRRARSTSGEAHVLVVWSLSFWAVFVVNAVAGPIFSTPDFILTTWVLMLIPAAVSRSASVSPPTRPSVREITAGPHSVPAQGLQAHAGPEARISSAPHRADVPQRATHEASTGGRRRPPPFRR